MSFTDFEGYDLPGKIAALGIHDEGRVEEVSGEYMNFLHRFFSSLEKSDNYDIVRESDIEGSLVYLGDGENVYKIGIDQGAGASILPDDYSLVEGECVGVCPQEQYEAIKRNEDGFKSVLDFLEREHEDAVWYDEDEGFVYWGEEEPGEDDGLPNSNAAQRQVDEVMSE